MSITGCSLTSILSDSGNFIGPRSRCKHAACVCGDLIYVCGGKDGNIPLNDIWCYNITTDQWSPVVLVGDKLPSLQEHSFVAYKNCLYIFGGSFAYASNSEVPLWQIDVGSLVCTKLGLVNNKDSSSIPSCSPSGRRGHTAVVYADAMYIYGGYVDMKGSSGELWKFDLVEHIWSLVHNSSPPSVDCPAARHSHSAVIHRHRLWIYGGISVFETLDDLWTWHFDTEKWSQIHFRIGPPCLEGHTACVTGHAMYIYGGCTDAVPQNSLWVFDFDFLSWTRISVHGFVSSPITKHCAVAIPHSRHVQGARRNLSMPAMHGRRPLMDSSVAPMPFERDKSQRSTIPLPSLSTPIQSNGWGSRPVDSTASNSLHQPCGCCEVCTSALKRNRRVSSQLLSDTTTLCNSSCEQLIVPDTSATKCHPSGSAAPCCQLSMAVNTENCACPNYGGDALRHASTSRLGSDNLCFHSDDELHLPFSSPAPDAENDTTVSNHISAAKTLMTPNCTRSSLDSLDSLNGKHGQELPAVEMQLYSMSVFDSEPNCGTDLTLEDLETPFGHQTCKSLLVIGSEHGSGLQQQHEVRCAWIDECQNHETLKDNVLDLPHQQQMYGEDHLSNLDTVIYVFGGRIMSDAPNLSRRPIAAFRLDVMSGQ